MSTKHCKREEEKESVVVCVKGKKHDLIWLWWFEWWRWEWCLVLDVQQVDFVANLGVAFMDDWAFLVSRVVSNGKD